MITAYPVVRVAHRGASGLYPENTLLAFEQAIACGVDALELDVHLSRDGQLVVIHDETLERTTNGTGSVNAIDVAQLRRLDAGQGQPLPMLAEVLALAEQAGVRLVVEPKGESQAESVRIAEATVAALQRAGWITRAIVSSFEPAALLRARSLEPRLATMLDPLPQDGSLSPRAMCEQALAAGANSLSYCHEIVTLAVAAECRLTGLALWPWGANTADEIQRLLDMGVPGIETDRPDILNNILVSAHGQV